MLLGYQGAVAPAVNLREGYHGFPTATGSLPGERRVAALAQDGAGGGGVLNRESAKPAGCFDFALFDHLSHGRRSHRTEQSRARTTAADWSGVLTRTIQVE